jgi:exopolyphosphatase
MLVIQERIFFFFKISEKVRDSPLKDSDVILKHFEQPSSGRWSKIVKATSFGLPSIQLDLSVDVGAQIDSVYDPSPTTFEENDEYHTLNDLARLAFEKSYSMEKRKENLSNIPLPESAATFYYGCSPEMEIVESCESINWLNTYLKARRDDINAGVPEEYTLMKFYLICRASLHILGLRLLLRDRYNVVI